MRRTDLLVLFFAGLGIGVAGGFLLAPDGGRGTRQRIGKLANRAGDAAKVFADKAKAAIDSAAEEATKTGEKFADEATNVAQGMGKRMADTGKRVQET